MYAHLVQLFCLQLKYKLILLQFTVNKNIINYLIK